MAATRATEKGKCLFVDARLENGSGTGRQWVGAAGHHCEGQVTTLGELRRVILVPEILTVRE
jgi:hypothetical protein